MKKIKKVLVRRKERGRLITPPFKRIADKGAVQIEELPERKIKRKPKKAPNVNFNMFGLNGNGAELVMAFLNQFEVQFMINHYQRVVETEAPNIDNYLVSNDHDKLVSYAEAQERIAYLESVQLKSEQEASQEVIP